MLRLNAALSFLLIPGWGLHQLSVWIGSLKPKHTADEIAANGFTKRQSARRLRRDPWNTLRPIQARCV